MLSLKANTWNISPKLAIVTPPPIELTTAL
jgi:hypothetical protein